jgi:8-oxo-dGTP pyrophosphatase MutT (NUDIX family)
MVRRPWTSRFMPGVWVFPGGAVDVDDASPPDAFGTSDDWIVAALRETMEETAIWITTSGIVERTLDGAAFPDVLASGLRLDPERLVYFANWITPEALPLRFDTRFYLVSVPAATKGTVDGDELVDLAWVNPSEALRRERDGVWDIAFPTRKTLEVLASGTSADGLVASFSGIDVVQPVQPRILVTDDEARIVLPDEDLFDAIASDQRDPDLLARLAAVVRTGGRVPAEFKRRS